MRSVVTSVLDDFGAVVRLTWDTARRVFRRPFEHEAPEGVARDRLWSRKVEDGSDRLSSSQSKCDGRDRLRDVLDRSRAADLIGE